MSKHGELAKTMAVLEATIQKLKQTPIDAFKDE